MSASRRVLITGAAGFLGVHLVRELASSWQVVGADRTDRPAGTSHGWLRIDDEAGGLARAVDAASPDLVVHAAFINRQDPGWSDEEYLGRQLTTNCRLLDRCAALEVPLILISSSAVYGPAAPAAGVSEEAPRRPVSLYGLAKAMQEMLAEQAAAARGLELGILRLFNLVGPGQGRGMLVPDWVSQVAAIAAGAEPVLRVWNRATSRDFVDVRDAARAAGLLARSFTPGEVYNVASGRAVSLRELGDFLQELCPVPYRTVEADSEPAATDVLTQRGDATKIARALGWKAETPWRQSVRDVWESYRSRPAQGRPRDGV